MYMTFIVLYNDINAFMYEWPVTLYRVEGTFSTLKINTTTQP